MIGRVELKGELQSACMLLTKVCQLVKSAVEVGLQTFRSIFLD